MPYMLRKQSFQTRKKLVDRKTVETIATELAEARKTISSMQSKLDKLPDIPISDGKCYALMNGAWVVIADVTETVLTMEDDK